MGESEYNSLQHTKPIEIVCNKNLEEFMMQNLTVVTNMMMQCMMSTSMCCCCCAKKRMC